MNDTHTTESYVIYMRTTHRRIHKVIHTIQQLWPSTAEEASTAPGELTSRLVRHLEQLRFELEQHFAEEENEGCLEEAVSRCLSLGRDAKEVKREHPQLLGELDSILGALRRPVSSPYAASNKLNVTHGHFRRFAKDLKAHEASESRVLERAFGISVE